jgi:hypothetical protein
MTNSPNLNLPYLLAAQSQKHVTHNEALRLLDTFVQLTVFSRTVATPPATPVEGDRYIVAASPAGAWVGQATKIAAYQDAAWMFFTPKEGWLTWIADENVALAYDGAAWIGFSGGGGVTAHSALTGLAADDHPQYHNNARGDVRYTPINPATLGVNATADATNKFAVSSAASLFNHVGTGGHQIKINKAAVTDTASFLFQTAFSGRAEIGLTGDDDFHFKVSPNGTTFSEAILINKTTGAVTFPNTALGGGEANTASNVGTAGVGLFKQKTGVNLELKKINAGSTKVTITDDTVNSEVDVDVVEANLTLANIGGTIDLGGVKASGTIAAARMPAHTGDVTSTAGAVALTIAANAVTNAKAAQMAAGTVKANTTGVAANAADVTLAALKTALAITTADFSGATTAAQEPAHTGDVTNTAGSLATTIAANAVTNAKAAQMPAATLKGNNTGAAANASDLTTAQVVAMLPAFVASGASHAPGLVPDPGATAGATRYLREDGTWFTPAGGGGGAPGGAAGQVQFNSAGIFGGFTVGGDATLDTSTGILTTGATIGRTANPLSQFAATTSAQLAGVISDETGTGALVFANTPALVTPVLGTPNSGNLANCTGYPRSALPTAPMSRQVFTASGTWTRPALCRWARVRVQAGGGGGPGATAAATQVVAGSGGWSGGYSESIIDVSAMTTQAITVGAAGAAGAAANGSGAAGGASSFGAVVTANGGSGGITMATAATALTVMQATGVAAGTGDIAMGGVPPGPGIRLSGTIGISGNGGSSPLGAGGPGTIAGTAAPGAATGFGSGGGGACANSATGIAGAAGRAGIVIVEEFY